MLTEAVRPYYNIADREFIWTSGSHCQSCSFVRVSVCENVFIPGTGVPVSLSRSGLLGAVALFLIQRNSDALVGRTMHPQRLKEIVDLLESDMVIQ